MEKVELDRIRSGYKLVKALGVNMVYLDLEPVATLFNAVPALLDEVDRLNGLISIKEENWKNANIGLQRRVCELENENAGLKRDVSELGNAVEEALDHKEAHDYIRILEKSNKELQLDRDAARRERDSTIEELKLELHREKGAAMCRQIMYTDVRRELEATKKQLDETIREACTEVECLKAEVNRLSGEMKIAHRVNDGRERRIKYLVELNNEKSAELLQLKKANLAHASSEAVNKDDSIDRNFILKAAVDTWGESDQTDKMLEEMSELAKALLKLRQWRKALTGYSEGDKHQNDVLEEMADVRIMLDQMVIIHGNTDKIEAKKLERLKTRVEEYRRSNAKGC